MMILYIGPGVGAATIIIVALVLGIVILSCAFVMWGTIKRFGRKIKQLFTGK